MSTLTQNKQTEELKRDLFSGNDATVMRALNKCNEKGNAAMVAPLIAFYATTTNATFKQEVAQMLTELKVSNVEGAFMDALENEAMKNIQKDLLSFMWNSGVQPVEGIATISRIALNGDYGVALEALTLIESMDDEISEEQLLESIADVTQHLSEAKAGDHANLLKEYLHVLQTKLDARD